MIKWLVKRVLGKTKREIKKSLLQSSTTRTVAVSSISTLAIVRGICAFLAELGLIPSEMVYDTAIVISAVLIPLISRLLAIVKAKLAKE